MGSSAALTMILGHGGLSGGPNPLFTGALFLLLAVLPLAAMCVTSFVKLSVVFSILRNGVGAGQVPSGAVTTALAMVLTLHVMAPVGSEMWTAFQTKAGTTVSPTGAAGETQKAPLQTPEGDVERVVDGVRAGLEPLRSFLLRLSGERERSFFAQLSAKRGGSGSQTEFVNLLPAFLISELHSAFNLGFVVFLPFLIVDIVVTNILVGLSMTMVNPVSISLPLKLLLFVSADGWYLLCRGLVLGYS